MSFLGFPLSWSCDYNWRSYQTKKYGLGLHKSDLVSSDYGQFYHWSHYPYAGPLYPRYPASRTMKSNVNDVDYRYYRDRDKYGHSGLIEDGHEKVIQRLGAKSFSKGKPSGVNVKSHRKDDKKLQALPSLQNDKKEKSKPKIT